MPTLKKAVTAACLNLPVRETLIAASEMGAEGVQFDVRTELRPSDLSHTGRRQFMKFLSEMNLELPSLRFSSRRAFYNANDLERRIAATKAAMDFAYQLGAKILTLRIGRIPTDADSPDYLVLREVLNGIARYGNHVGVAAAITPSGDHPVDLARLLGDITEGPLGLDFDPAGFLMSGHDPVSTLRELHQWIFHVQARDGLQDASGSGLEVALGRGEIDWLEFVATLDEIAYRGWLIVTRTQGEDRAGDAERALKYLRNIDAPQ